MSNVPGLTTVVLLLAGCATNTVATADNQTRCQAIFDAGSTGTRLWIYYQDGNDWTGVRKQETSALADQAARKVDPEAAQAIVGQLEAFKETMAKSGCGSISSIKVLATAGMRLAEKNDSTSSKFWQQLFDALSDKNKNVTVTTQTITGYEEGIYAWLARREERRKAGLADNNFGVAEMGGVSTQVVFPCLNCADTKTIYAGTGNALKLFVHSFLRLGTTQLPESLGFRPEFPPACKWGAGLQPPWEKEYCAKLIEPRLLVPQTVGRKTSYQIRDPSLGMSIPIPDTAHVKSWYFAGSFAFMDVGINGDVHSCCEHRREKFRGCFDEERSCFISIYRPLFLKSLGIEESDLERLGEAEGNHKELGEALGRALSMTAEQLKKLDTELGKLDKEDARVKQGNDVSWTLGAAICEAAKCLPKRAPDQCSWLTDSKCLAPPKEKKPTTTTD